MKLKSVLTKTEVLHTHTHTLSEYGPVTLIIRLVAAPFTDVITSLSLSLSVVQRPSHPVAVGVRRHQRSHAPV